jgi:hypothetical protein
MIYDNGYSFVAVFPDKHEEEYATYEEAEEALK